MLRIDPAAYDELRRHGEEAYPRESCGVLLGRVEDGEARVAAALARCANACTGSPENRYHIDPEDLLRIQRQGRERGQDIVGFYHSHPDHLARPSGTDLAEAHWPGCSYVITRVARGRAEATASFVLAVGAGQEKRFLDEEIQVVSP